MTGYDYGNTRLRARRAALLGREQYEALAVADPGSLNRIARDHLVSALAGIAEFYRGQARNVVAALLSPFDVHAVLTVLRGRHHGVPAEAACALVEPVGAVSAEAARRAAREPDLPAAARLFAARRLPDADTAAALIRAQRGYEIDGDLARVEEAVTSTAHARRATVLAAAGPKAEQVTAAVRRETDDLNLLLALRLREAGADGSGPGDRNLGDRDLGDREAYLPGGSLPLPRLRAIQRAPTRPDAVAAASTSARPAWGPPLAAWSESGDLAALHADLEAERLRTQLRVLRGGDPLGAAPVLHYVLAHQVQARNLRLLGQAAVGAMSHDEARRQLITLDRKDIRQWERPRSR